MPASAQMLAVATTAEVLVTDPTLVEVLPPDWVPEAEASQSETPLAEEHLYEVQLAAHRQRVQWTGEDGLVRS